MSEQRRTYSIRALAERYGISVHMVRTVVARLGIERGDGKGWAIAPTDLWLLELGIRAAGYDRPEAAKGRGRVAPNKGWRKRRPEAATA